MLVAAITRIRGGQPQSLKEFARFQKDKKLNDLSMDDLRQQTPTTSGNSVNVQRSDDNVQSSSDNVKSSGDNNNIVCEVVLVIHPYYLLWRNFLKLQDGLIMMMLIHLKS
ncbi:Hypothetical predicted protein [Mytilus galloprovincialis]|uniref:Uncharacterized protein n=1 Tax=Mytilus galloprovincialis TaxID=29158 RepID=A0A8B6G3L3_MYTGA|nr:Hypothetical predicted protein [Mytilus galloprovincialis]